MIKAKLIERLHKSQSRYKHVIVPALEAKIQQLKTQIVDLETRLQDIRDITRFGKTVKRFPRTEFVGYGSQGGKKSASNMTKAERIARAEKARAAQLKNKKEPSDD